MVIQFKIPNGTMSIDAKAFFQGARITRIRKMFKMYRESSPKLEDVLILRAWLMDQIASENQAAKDAAEEHINERSRLRDLEDQYEQMKSPCYAFYTHDKEVLQEAKQLIIDCRKQCRALLRQSENAVKAEARYKDVFKEFCRLFEGEGGTE